MITIRRGSTGAAVLQWQGIIGVGESGVFDIETESATAAWQRLRGLEPDGVVGPQTWGVAGVHDVSTDHLVPTVRTVVTMKDYARAVVRAWPIVGDGIPDKGSVGVLWAQYMIETGGRDSWGWNIGNTKEIPNDGINYHALRGVWEGVTPAEAARLIASGQAVADMSRDHAAAVGPGKVSVVFSPPHPATWFSSFDSLDHAMEHHLRFLARRFAPAWPAVLAGDPRKFAHALKSRGYFSASAEAYAAGMRRPFEAFMMASVYEDAVAGLDLSAPPTLPEGVPNPASEPTIYAAAPSDQPIIHADPRAYFDPEKWAEPSNEDD